MTNDASFTEEVEAKPPHAGRFVAGEGWRGNRNGRPRKGKAFTERLEYYLTISPSDLRKLPINSLPSIDAMAIRFILRGLTLRGEKDRIYVVDRIDGKPRQTVDLAEEGTDELYELMEEMGEALSAFKDPVVD
jgi:hypothetical protein